MVIPSVQSSRKRRKKVIINYLKPEGKDKATKIASRYSRETLVATKEAGMFQKHQTLGSVLCCKCGIRMAPNPASMCAKCIRSEVDITEGLQKHVTIMHCSECDCYLQPPKTWIKAQLESKELLSLCVNRLKKLNKVHLVGAEFVWTEPHSKRINVKVTVEKEVFNGAVLSQPYVVEYVLNDHMCCSCSRVQSDPDQWVASVQLRQHVSHRRTFFYLEQLILKHDAAVHAIKIKQMEHGIDFFFANRSHGLKFVEFVGKVVPTKSRNDKQLVSHDTKSNNYNYKYTFSVEICPICREDLICLPPKVALSLGNIGPLVLCTKVSSSIFLLDPFTLRHSSMDAEQYWRGPFVSLLSSRHLVEYIVLYVESLSSEVIIGGSKYALADVQVARKSDFGKNDNIFLVRTHLGHLINPGDYVLGYDLYGANNNAIEMEKYRNLILPDAILIKNCFEKPLPRKLKSLNIEVDDSYRRLNEKMTSMNIGQDVPSVEELFADLDLHDEEDYEQSMRK